MSESLNFIMWVLYSICSWIYIYIYIYIYRTICERYLPTPCHIRCRLTGKNLFFICSYPCCNMFTLVSLHIFSHVFVCVCLLAFLLIVTMRLRCLCLCDVSLFSRTYWLVRVCLFVYVLIINCITPLKSPSDGSISKVLTRCSKSFVMHDFII